MPRAKGTLNVIPGKYDNYERYRCESCGKLVRKNNKWCHEKTQTHRMMVYCKRLVNKKMNEMLKSNINI